MITISRFFLTILIFAWADLTFNHITAQNAWFHRKHAQWQSGSPPDASQLLSSVYLIGDAGQPEKDRVEPNFTQILHQARQTKAESDIRQTLIFLGDNIYKVGLPPADVVGRAEAERRINQQLDLIKVFPGQGYMVPGNHDWHRQSAKGWEAVKRQQAYVGTYLNDTSVFQPGGGCPGPIVIEQSESQVLILLDTEWFLHRHNKPMGLDDGCEVVDDVDFFVQIQDALRRHEGKHILIAMHHPMFSNGAHGGYYTLKEHIFPLTDINEGLFIPLPVIGTLYPLARKYGVSAEDLPHPRYQMLIDGLLGAIGQQDYVVMAAGHEHSLALHPYEQAYHILSGSGSRVTQAKKGKGAEFVYSGKGFSRVNYYQDGEVWVEFWRPIEDGSKGEMLFRMPLYARDSTSPQISKSSSSPSNVPKVANDSVIGYASKVFQRSKLYRAILGSHNRDLWTTDIKVPILDMDKDGEGLTPIKKGGGFQTLSLRLQGKDGHQYTVRSIDKDPEKFLPQGLRNTLVHAILKDQISVANPYGAFAIPKLADAVGVYHTNPRLVSIPYSPHLGHHLDEFGGLLALFEIRPYGDLAEFNRFGNAPKVVSSPKMFERLKKDNDNEIDKKHFAKSRLFDMLIGDLDRHQDQWRWVEFKNEDGSRLYQPIPRDRDQVFLKVDGLIPNILTAKWAIREIESYEFEIQDLWGLNNRGFPLDQQLLAAYSEKDWVAAAEEIKASLSDETIEAAIRDLPKEIYALSGERIIPRLKKRRDDLPKYASQYYHLQAKQVVIVGSDKQEKYEIIRHKKTKETEIIGHKIKKNGKEGHKIYERSFDPSETREIRIFGLGGDDEFIFKGKGKGNIKVRIIGGPGQDEVEDHSEEKKASKRAIYYDEKKENNHVDTTSSIRLRLGNSPWYNSFEIEKGTPDYKGPAIGLAFNPDDGIFLGGGTHIIKRRGFRKKPYVWKQTATLSVAVATGSMLFKYNGDFIGVFGRNWNLKTDLALKGLAFAYNYFGEGNETMRHDRPIDFNRILQQVGELEFFRLSGCRKI